MDKVITFLIFISIEILIGLLLSKLIFCNIGKAIMLAYSIVSIILAETFAIGLDEGDF